MKAPTHAERVLLELGIDRPQDIDLEAIAWHLGAVVNYRPMDGAEATIVGGKTKAVIAVNSLSMPERRRFSLGHELGHWRYHRGRCLVCASSDIGRFEASNPLERQADGFASDLLLPGYLVRSYFNKIKSLSLRAVRDIATEFKASLTATLIRLVDEDQFPIAIVCHGQGGRRWGKRSPSVEGWWKFRDDIDPESFAFELLYKGGDDQPHPRLIGADAWFDFRGADRYEIREQSYRVPNDEIITLLILPQR